MRTINSNLVAWVISLFPKNTEVIDVYMHNSYVCVVTDNKKQITNVTIKIKQNEQNIKRAEATR
jgi:hypothetical protein